MSRQPSWKIIEQDEEYTVMQMNITTTNYERIYRLVMHAMTVAKDLYEFRFVYYGTNFFTGERKVIDTRQTALPLVWKEFKKIPYDTFMWASMKRTRVIRNTTKNS